MVTTVSQTTTFRLQAQMDHSGKSKSLEVTMHSFLYTGLELMHLQNYTFCVTANLSHDQIGPINQTITVELQGELLHNVQVS